MNYPIIWGHLIPYDLVGFLIVPPNLFNKAWKHYAHALTEVEKKSLRNNKEYDKKLRELLKQ
jgi:hypothetical protein